MLSTCAKCGGHIFEVVEQSPMKSNFKIMFVQCASCGTSIGTMDYFDVNSHIDKLEGKIVGIESNMSTIQSHLANIELLLRNRQ